MKKIILTGNPLSTQNLYKISCRSGFGTMYMSNASKSMKEIYQWQAKEQWKNEILYCPLYLEAKLYFQDHRKRDIDNHSKIFLDALTGIVWGDDKQIEKITIEKLYDHRSPRIEIIINKLKHYGKENKKSKEVKNKGHKE